MSQWGYVSLGWIAMYAVVVAWYFTSRMPAESKTDSNDNAEDK